MNDALMKQQEATNETPPTGLSEPHFDEIAVLIAQPVELIARPEHDWFAWLEKPRMMIAILVVAGLLGTTALALTLQLQRQPHVDSAATGIIKADESPVEPGSPLGAITEQLESTAPRTKKRKARPGDTSGTKPVARRVGVIYGNGSGQP